MVLTENLLQALIQYIPAPDQLNRLKEFEKDYDNLAEAEQFAISISGIKRLVPRLKSLMFAQRYPELVQDCKPHIVSATAACEEVKKSKKFAKILELILLIGKAIFFKLCIFPSNDTSLPCNHVVTSGHLTENV